MIMEKIIKEDEDVAKDMVVVVAEKEEVEAIVTTSTMMKGSMNHIEVEDEQEKEVTILNQMYDIYDETKEFTYVNNLFCLFVNSEPLNFEDVVKDKR